MASRDPKQGQQTVWEGCVVEGPIKAIELTGQEGIDRLFLHPLEGFQDRVTAAISTKVGESAGAVMENIITSLIFEAGLLGIKLGAALAMNLTADTFEEWLQLAIDRAGLDDYELGPEWSNWVDKIAGE